MEGRVDASGLGAEAFGDWFDALDDGLILVRGGRVVRLNAAAGRLLEVDPEAAVGVPLIGVLRDHRLETVFCEGGEVELETRGRVLRAKATPTSLLLRDITEARRAQESARELLAVLSHELRTPATAIRSSLEALRYPLPEEQRERFLAHAEAETERLVRLLDDLTVDVKPPRLRSLALREVLARAEALLEDTFEAHRVRLKTDVPPLMVWADADKLLQVLINLLENAAIHGPDGATVHLSARPVGSMVQVVVRDEGTPLPQGGIERLFEPHARGRRVKVKGTGLGLYIVRSIAQRWGGQAWGRPLPSGNEFGFSVPLKGSAQASEPPR
ncbi:sensor histidine kinase [Truepera radiovictrix]|uniref:sensor histidine kinase n=1 Tax=Truepera radiovictrix TaxID=332249 RepID=UPI00030DB2C0|nr:ATP-binding protein [Truepera radiovictrix]WMT57424.1 ATP-binding protein [Truepera radiovictrix]